jgi:hypothetical protein
VSTANPDPTHAAIAGAPVRLGKADPRVDPRTLKLAKYFGGNLLPALPASERNAVGLAGFPMLANNRYGNCTCAALGHAYEVIEWRDGKGTKIQADEQAVEQLYWATGNPTTPGADDSGRNMLDILKYIRTNGLFGRKVVAFAQFDPRNHDHYKAVILLFGFAYVGLQLPAAAQGHSVWAGIDPSSPEGKPGSWGGHTIINQAYNPPGGALAMGGTVGVTWGKRINIGWDFLDAYADEAYAIIFQDWLDASGTSPDNFDLAALQADLAAL